MTPETKLKNQVITYFKGLKKFWYFKVWQGPFSKAGIPDIIGCYRGVFFAIELKSKKGSVSALQRITMQMIKYAGGQTAVCYTLDEVKEFIEHIERSLEWKNMGSY